MRTADLGKEEFVASAPDSSAGTHLSRDPRWQLIERIAASEAFQKSSRLPSLLKYLAQCTILEERNGLTEQNIARAVFHKGEDYSPTEDSSVRVYVRQLRVRLRDFYHEAGRDETIVVDVPKGGYALAFTTSTACGQPKLELGALDQSFPASRFRTVWFLYLLLLACVVLAVGWYRAATSQHRVSVPWPINQVVDGKTQTTVVLADVSYSLRLLGQGTVPLDQYVDHSFIKQVMPEHMSDGEARLLHYLAASKITSMADARAAAVLSQLSAPFSNNLIFRSARDLSPDDLTHGNLIFVGAQTSNPWVQLFDGSLNFHIIEDFGKGGGRYILNHVPEPGEQPKYAVPDMTGTSGEDYATIALLPNLTGSGNILLIQGLRMEGTEAAIYLLRDDELRSQLQSKLTAGNRGHIPAFFEVLLHSKSVAGAPLSVKIISVRILRP